MSERTSPWEFLPADNPAIDDPVPDNGDEPAEERAMHVSDAGRHRLAASARAADTSLPSAASGTEDDDDLEQGVDALLTRQHYLSAPSDQPAGPAYLRSKPTATTPAALAAWAVKRLEAERVRLTEVQSAVDHAGGSSSQQELSGDLTGLDQHAADSATETFDLEATRSLGAALDEEVAEVAAALARVTARTYGFCERCGDPISIERLDAVPATRYCRQDETAVERWA